MSADASARGRRNRANGQQVERTVAARFTEHGIACRRTLEETRSPAGSRTDLEFEPGCPLRVQVRSGLAPSPWRALRDAQAASGPTDVPVAIVRKRAGRGRPATDVVVLELRHFLDLASRLWGAESTPPARHPEGP